MDKEMMKGSIDLLLLSLVSQRDAYGYEMTKALKELSGGDYEMSEGTLYPALKRLERKGYVTSYWHEAPVGRRKYYCITDLGKKELETKKKNWDLVHNLVKRSSEGFGEI